MVRVQRKRLTKPQSRKNASTPGRRAKLQRSVRTGPVSDQEAAKRRLHVLEVAGDEFIKNGFWQASIAAIAKKSRVSKATIYREYGCKEKLFQEFMSANIKGFRHDMEQTVNSGRPLINVVRDVIRLAVSTICDKRTIALLRLTIAERDRFPTVARMVFEEAKALWRPLALYLHTAAGDSTISAQEAEQCSLHLMNMAVGGFGGLLENPVSYFGNRDSWVESVTRMFLERFPPRG